MKNKITTAVLSLSLMAVLAGCQKKDLPLDGGMVKERQAALDLDIKKMLQGAEYGFQLYPESSATVTAVTSSANFTMKFDTVTNQVTMSSGLSSYAGPATSYYTLSSATGMPLLTFSTSSFISRIYATGDKGITDFFFRVMRISGDTIKVQPYRKGNIYASEGGPVFNMVKVKPSIDIPGRSANDTINVVLTRLTDNTVTLRNPVRFGAALNVASFNTSVGAELSADPGLVDAYNRKNNTQYKAFPEGTYELLKNHVDIPAGAKYSVDSFEVGFRNLAAFTAGEDYLLPVKATAAAPFVPGLRSVAYIVMRINNVNPVNSEMAGALISRINWSITASGNLTPDFSVSRLLDGNNATAWLSDGVLPTQLVLNMGETKTVRGFRLTPCYELVNMSLSTVNVYTSADGIRWQYTGTYEGTQPSPFSSGSNPDIKFLSFINPVTARYFRFEVVKGSQGYSNTGLGEINAVE